MNGMDKKDLDPLFQFRLSTWIVLAAALGWAFAIGPKQLVWTDTHPYSNGTHSVSTTKILNPHYFAPICAVAAFACWKEIFNQYGTGMSASRRRMRRIAIGVSLLATVLAIGTLYASMHYSRAAAIPITSGPQVWTRMWATNWSLACYCSTGVAVGLIVGLMVSMSDVRRTNVATC